MKTRVGGALAVSNPAYAPEAERVDKLAVTLAPAVAPGDTPLPLVRPAVTAMTSVPLPRSRPLRFAEVEAQLQAEAKPDVARVALVPAAPSPRIAAAAPHAPQSREVVYSLASADAVPWARVERAPGHAQSGHAVYSLASTDPVPPTTTGSIGAATKLAASASPAAPAKAAGPALAYANPDVPMRDNRTAIYDIVAHIVYMPNGERLEAHSGRGRMLDDPHYASAKARGPTPPNVYDLTLREGLFHGVQAIRLNPVSENKMFGREGILAHTYMLGPSGQSFGCVSFRHYAEFLHAFQRGEVNRMVVVPHFQEPPPGVRADADSGNRYASSNIKDY